MTLLALGINHKTASVELRERVAFPPEKLKKALQQLEAHPEVNSGVIVSTCNRTELFVFAESEDQQLVEQQIWQWMSDYHSVALDELIACSYCHQGNQALRHMIEVCSGLDSMVLGEPQIFGQMKSAFAVSQEANTVSGDLGRLIPHVFKVAKKVRTDTAIGKNPVSVAFAAVTSRVISTERFTQWKTKCSTGRIQ